MTIHPCPYPYIVGIDVSKSTLDIFDTSGGTNSRIANAPEPILALARQWRQAKALIVFEGEPDQKSIQ